MSYSVQKDLDAIKGKIEDLFTSKFYNLSTEDINELLELTNNAKEEKFEPSSVTYSD